MRPGNAALYVMIERSKFNIDYGYQRAAHDPDDNHRFPR